LQTARVRVGMAWNNWMPFIAGGAAFGGVKASASASALGFTATASDNDVRTGWTIGGGAEYAFASGLRGKIEYLYVDHGSENQLLVDRVKFTSHIVRAGLNWRLGDLVH
jgi:outer membrane immunogenic protein